MSRVVEGLGEGARGVMSQDTNPESRSYRFPVQVLLRQGGAGKRSVGTGCRKHTVGVMIWVGGEARIGIPVYWTVGAFFVWDLELWRSAAAPRCPTPALQSRLQHGFFSPLLGYTSSRVSAMPCRRTWTTFGVGGVGTLKNDHIYRNILKKLK